LANVVSLYRIAGHIDIYSQEKGQENELNLPRHKLSKLI